MPVEPNAPVRFGLECAGKIVNLGDKVEGWEIGDEVIAFGSNCFSRYITSSTELIVKKPKFLSIEEAATIPVAFMTAYYGLIELARLRRGEKVLIHAATGGVGMAAVQVAQWVGAEILATAGNPEKRAFLQGLGIECIMDSRSLDFAMDFRVISFNGEGNHIHALIEYPPKLSVSQIVNALKGVSSRRYGQAGYKKPHKEALWSPSYFAISVGGAPLEVLKEYIKNQEKPLL